MKRHETICSEHKNATKDYIPRDRDFKIQLEDYKNTLSTKKTQKHTLKPIFSKAFRLKPTDLI